MRFYFHIRDHGLVIPDEEGSELSGITAAQVEARASAMDIAMDDLRGNQSIDERQIEIASESGRVLEIISVRDILLSRMH